MLFLYVLLTGVRFGKKSKPKINVTNVTACGDAFSAGFLHEYLKNKNIEEALKEGSRCAALNAQSVVPGSIKL